MFKKYASITFNEDCMKVMARYPTGYFDIAIVDIPYGINVGKMAYLTEKKTTIKQKNGTRLDARKNKKAYTLKEWDLNPPPQEYFDELRRISKHQIIFGVEYVNWEGLGKGRIRWNKGVPEEMSFKGYEIAYCSLIENEIEINLLWHGMQQAKSLSEPMTSQGNKKLNEKRIHPTHKPVLLYKKILMLFAKVGMKIMDTHLGGGSNRIACYDFGCEFVGSEIDKEYFEDEENRFKAHTYNLFDSMIFD